MQTSHFLILSALAASVVSGCNRLAASGISLTNHYAGCTVCAPSRSGLMTGLHTGITPIRGNLEVKPEGQAPLPAGPVTIPEMLKELGGKQTILKRDWKAVRLMIKDDPQSMPEFYNIAEDPKEKNNQFRNENVFGRIECKRQCIPYQVKFNIIC